MVRLNCIICILIGMWKISVCFCQHICRKKFIGYELITIHMTCKKESLKPLIRNLHILLLANQVVLKYSKNFVWSLNPSNKFSTTFFTDSSSAHVCIISPKAWKIRIWFSLPWTLFPTFFNHARRTCHTHNNIVQLIEDLE